MTHNQRRVAYAIGLIGGFIAGLIAYLGEPAPRSVEGFLFFAGGGLLGGYLLARMLVPSSKSTLETDATVTSTSERDPLLKIEVSSENFGSVARRSYWVCVGLFVMDLAIGVYLVDDWGTVPGLVGWLVWGFVMMGGLILWYVFRKRALEREIQIWRHEPETSVKILPVDVFRDWIYSWAGILIVGIAGMVIRYTEAGVLLALSAGIGGICFLVSYPTKEEE